MYVFNKKSELNLTHIYLHFYVSTKWNLNYWLLTTGACALLTSIIIALRSVSFIFYCSIKVIVKKVLRKCLISNMGYVLNMTLYTRQVYFM